MEQSYLSAIHSPEDLKQMDESLLPALASEIRQVLIETVSHNGGHLASNLGVVELTIALHRVFHSPYDQIVFDVGHQCYTHKLLTGRYERFSTVRQKDGLCGFPKPAESEHDIFASGHSGTSVSSTLGLASAKTLDGDTGYCVAVIGDGSFGGGMVYEALNNGGRRKNRQIIILNDNQMSISENVGMLAKQLSVLRIKPEYFFLKAATERAFNRIPLVGKQISAGVFKIKTDLKNRLYKKSTFFEQLGYRYMGPVDGHDLKQLCQALEGAKGIHGPVLLHVNTVKGKGYDYAENAPSRFHGISAFDVKTGMSQPGKKTYSDIFGEFMCRKAETDERLCAVTAAMGLGTGLSAFEKAYADRFFDVGIAEEHAVTFCAGLSKNGKIPVFAVYSTFFQRCYDQMIHDIALQKLHAVFALDRAGFVGEDGETHQGLFDVAMLNTVPYVKIYSPCSYAQLNSDLEKAICRETGAVAVRYPRGTENPLPKEISPADDWFCYANEQADITVMTYGRLCSAAANTVRSLADSGKSVNLIGLNLIKPIPVHAVEKAMKAKTVLFFEEGVENGGVGSQVCLLLCRNGFQGQFRLFAVDEIFIPQASVKDQLSQWGFDEKSMRERVESCE